MVSLQEALDGVYIDFEGNVDHDASLLGVLYRGSKHDVFFQMVHEETLWPAADAKASNPKFNCERASIDNAAQLLLDLSASGRRVYAFSEREAQVFREEATEPLGNSVADLIVNVRKPAKRWKSKFFRDKKFVKHPRFLKSGKNTLANFLDLIDIHYPAYLGFKKTGPRIAAVRNQLTKKQGDWTKVTPTVKAKWTKALAKNRLDCEYLRDLTVRIAKDAQN